MISKEEISNIDLKNIIENETGLKFDIYNQICCPFHNESTPSFTVKKYPDKDRYYCFGCGAKGDLIDFIKEYNDMSYQEACEYLNIEPNEGYSKLISLLDQVKKVIDKINFKDKNNIPLKYLRTHVYMDKDNNPLYFEARFKNSSNKSESRFLSINKNNKIVPERGADAVPYNYYNLLMGLKNEKDIFIVEGAKDADTLIHFGYLATSLKGVTDFDYSIFKDARVYIIPDTGEAGEKYKDNLYYKLKDHVQQFNVIYPKGLSELGDNKDITDWFQSGKSLSDFKAALRDKWDYMKSKFWRDVDIKVTSKGQIITPKKTWRNVEQVLKAANVKLSYNLISKEAEATGNISSSGDELIIDIQTTCSTYNFNINKDLACDAILKIARKNQYNLFIDYLKSHKNNNYKIIEDIFNCLAINDEFINKRDTYLKYFTTWLMDLISMSQNTIEKGLKSQGVLVLQGKQGIRKSTFFKKLMNNSNWFKGESYVEAKDKDSIMQNTSYILSELSEFDGMTKKDQESMKRFLTNDVDIYRVPYGKSTEKHPRITTFCATVNPRDFLKDRTGSRRFWVIPIEMCDIDSMNNINIDEFWGAVYDLYCTGTVKSYLDADETETLLQDNTAFNMESDITIAINEKFDFNQNQIAWRVYNISELLGILDIRESKALKNELERRRFKYQTHRDNYSDKTKKGYKLPNIYIKEAQKLEKDLQDNLFGDKEPIQQEIAPKEVSKKWYE